MSEEMEAMDEAIEAMGEFEESVKELFDEFDDDESGTLDVREMERLFRELGLTSTKREMKKIIKDFDEDHDGEISLFELIEIVREKKVFEDEFCTQKHLLAAFEAFDTDGNGFISREEFENILGDEYDQEELDEILEDVDYDDDGQLNYEEFVEFLTRVKEEDKDSEDEEEGEDDDEECDQQEVRGPILQTTERGPILQTCGGGGGQMIMQQEIMQMTDNGPPPDFGEGPEEDVATEEEEREKANELPSILTLDFTFNYSCSRKKGSPTKTQLVEVTDAFLRVSKSRTMCGNPSGTSVSFKALNEEEQAKVYELLKSAIDESKDLQQESKSMEERTVKFNMKYEDEEETFETDDGEQAAVFEQFVKNVCDEFEF